MKLNVAGLTILKERVIEMKINWQQKLTSRKFWAAVVGFATPLIVVLSGSPELETEIAAFIMSGATLIAYIIGEGLVDASRKEGK